MLPECVNYFKIHLVNRTTRKEEPCSNSKTTACTTSSSSPSTNGASRIVRPSLTGIVRKAPAKRRPNRRLKAANMETGWQFRPDLSKSTLSGLFSYNSDTFRMFCIQKKNTDPADRCFSFGGLSSYEPNTFVSIARVAVSTVPV